MTFGKRLKRLRESQGLTQVDLASKVGVTDKAVSTWENDVFIPRMGTIEKLAYFFGVKKSFLMGEDSDIPPAPDLIPVRRVRIPLLGDIAAGEPILATEEHEEYVEIDADTPSCDYALRVISDSMEPTVHVGDTVFIRQQADVDDGRIAAVLMDDHSALKRVRHIKGGLLLISDNAAKYEPRVVMASEFDTLKILGLAVAYRRNL